MTGGKDALRFWLIGTVVVAGISRTLAREGGPGARIRFGLLRRESDSGRIWIGPWRLASGRSRLHCSDRRCGTPDRKPNPDAILRSLLQLPLGLRSLEEALGFEIRNPEGSGRGWFGYRLQDIVDQLFSLGRMAAYGVTSLIVVLIGAVYFASNPELYRTGLIKMFPARQHERIRERSSPSPLAPRPGNRHDGRGTACRAGGMADRVAGAYRARTACRSGQVHSHCRCQLSAPFRRCCLPARKD